VPGGCVCKDIRSSGKVGWFAGTGDVGGDVHRIRRDTAIGGSDDETIMTDHVDHQATNGVADGQHEATIG
jgi:hypothetical protein